MTTINISLFDEMLLVNELKKGMEGSFYDWSSETFNEIFANVLKD